MAWCQLARLRTLVLTLFTSCTTPPSTACFESTAPDRSAAFEFILLLEWDGTSPLTPFVSFEGADPPPEVMSRLRSRIPLIAGRTSLPDDGAANMSVEISLVTARDDGTLEIRYDECDGCLIGQGLLYVVARTEDGWKVISRRLEWVA